MKKLIFALLAVLAFAGAHAQNANRTGFFIEAAIGGTTGDTPVAGASLDGSTLMGHYPSGASLNIAFGPRFRTSNHWAFDLRFVLQAPTDYLTTMPVGKLMPAFRYISPELFGNISLYATFGIGGAIAPMYNRWGTYRVPIPTGPEVEKFDISQAENVSFGPAYMAGIGLNITTHFYGGFIFDSQYMFNSCRTAKSESINWGMAGFQIGYRF